MTANHSTERWGAAILKFDASSSIAAAFYANVYGLSVILITVSNARTFGGQR